MFHPPRGLTGEKVVYDESRERRLPGAAFPLFCAGKQWLGPKKAPAGTNGRRASAVSRAQSGVRTAPAQDAPARAGARRQDTRAKRVRRRRGRKGAERNAMEERYAGTEPQSFGGGIRNMTSHDTMQGSSMNLPACAPAEAAGEARQRPPGSGSGAGSREGGPRRLVRAIRRANRAGVRRAQAGAGAQARYARKKGARRSGQPGGGGADGRG